jgi:hypothetical protein
MASHPSDVQAAAWSDSAEQAASARSSRKRDREPAEGARAEAPCPAQQHAALARISSSRRPQDAIAAFAGGALPHTILSCCHNALLAMFTTKAVLPFRATCRDAAAAVAAHAWDDWDTLIHGNLGPTLLPSGMPRGAWRGCFPRARGANVSGQWRGGRRTPVTDADFVHLAGLQRLNMSNCALRSRTRPLRTWRAFAA